MIICNLTPEISKLARSYTDLATISLAQVYASSPDLVEQEATGLQITSGPRLLALVETTC